MMARTRIEKQPVYTSSVFEPRLVSLTDCLKRKITINEQINQPINLIELVSEVTGVAVKDILGKCRSHPIVFARHIYRYFLHQHYDNGWAIQRMGLADHATVRHSCLEVESLVAQNMYDIPYWVDKIRNETQIRTVDYGIYIR